MNDQEFYQKEKIVFRNGLIKGILMGIGIATILFLVKHMVKPIMQKYQRINTIKYL